MTTDAADRIDDHPEPDRFHRWLAMASLALLAVAGWLRFGPGGSAVLVAMGEPMPPTRLSGLHDDGSRLLLGMEGRVLWLVFLPAESAGTTAVLPAMIAAWERLGDDPRFGLAVAATDPLGPAHARSALASSRGKLPLYLAGAEVSRAFGVFSSGEPRHFLIDAQGRVAAVARGSASETVDRLADMAADWLQALPPADDVRFRLAGEPRRWASSSDRSPRAHQYCRRWAPGVTWRG